MLAASLKRFVGVLRGSIGSFFSQAAFGRDGGSLNPVVANERPRPFSSTSTSSGSRCSVQTAYSLCHFLRGRWPWSLDQTRRNPLELEVQGIPPSGQKARALSRASGGRCSGQVAFPLRQVGRRGVAYKVREVRSHESSGLTSH
jgi:hypothetical protein